MASIYRQDSLLRKAAQVAGADRCLSAHGVRWARARSNSRRAVVFLLGSRGSSHWPVFDDSEPAIASQRGKTPRSRTTAFRHTVSAVECLKMADWRRPARPGGRTNPTTHQPRVRTGKPCLLRVCAIRLRAILTPVQELAYQLSGRKLCPFFRSLDPATAEGLEEMHYRLHMGERCLSKLILGRE
jgi:hypothetical protein